MEHVEKPISLAGGKSIYTQEWKPDHAKAAVVLVHGLGEHSGRYQHVAGAFNRAGYALLAADLPGHGQTGGPRGHIPSYEVALDLISCMLDEARSRYPGLPVFLYGHSMGGNLVLYYGLQRQPNLAGMICTSPGLGVTEPVPGWKVLLGRILYNMLPAFQMDNGLDVNNLSHDPRVIEKYKNDPLVHGKVSARLGLDVIGNGEYIVAHAAEFPPIPLLLMQGSQDHIVNPPATERFAKRTGALLTYKVWDGLYHELHNEPQQGEVIAYMIGWLDGLVC